ncbi:transposase, partial [Halorhodospira halochloris]|uniref:transposase n=1 Tax=Halorhodospira halochloris TaxID=1052 RepID=UPI001EE805D0
MHYGREKGLAQRWDPFTISVMKTLTTEGDAAPWVKRYRYPDHLSTVPYTSNHGNRISAVICGAVLVREAIEHTGLIEGLGSRLLDPRDPRRVTHPLSELLRDALVMTAQGWGDQGDAEHLRGDPLFALTGSDRRGQAVA